MCCPRIAPLWHLKIVDYFIMKVNNGSLMAKLQSSRLRDKNNSNHSQYLEVLRLREQESNHFYVDKKEVFYSKGGILLAQALYSNLSHF